jgi:hypothetical protein
MLSPNLLPAVSQFWGALHYTLSLQHRPFKSAVSDEDNQLLITAAQLASLDWIGRQLRYDFDRLNLADPSSLSNLATWHGGECLQATWVFIGSNFSESDFQISTNTQR